MADISQVKLPNGDTYNLVDETSGYIKNYTETDPVFSASAAAGITSTDISNWNGKSDTDEKLKTNLVSDTEMYYPIFGNASTIAENKQYSDSFKFQCGSNNANLTLGKQNDKQGVIQIWYGNYITYLYGNGNSTANHIVYLPARQGTLALTSDIPSVYSSTNTGGYLTMATLPIYDGTVV